MDIRRYESPHSRKSLTEVAFHTCDPLQPQQPPSCNILHIHFSSIKAMTLYGR